MNQNHLKAYAKLLVETGLNIVPGDSIKISLSEESLPLARLVAEEAYKRGALRIYYDLRDDQTTLTRYLYASDDSFSSVPDYDVEVDLARFHDRTHRLSIVTGDPDLLKNVDSERISNWRKIASRAMKPIQELGMSNKIKWCVAGVPSESWAKQVFPDLSAKDALEKLWSLLFKVVRADQEDVVGAWKAHDRKLKEREARMNEHQFVSLRYDAPGTSFEVGLVENHVWIGGSSNFGDHEKFMANIPTEEIFTMPDRSKANGRLQATLPLSLNGRLIEDFWFKFKNGEVVDLGAAKGKEVLEQLLETDQGAKRLGEVALVDMDSPIYQAGVLFKDTLFDENASCHFALGAAYSENLSNSGLLSEDEKTQLGMNQSIIHVDFMVGSEKLNIRGVKKDGSEVEVLNNGRFVLP